MLVDSSTLEARRVMAPGHDQTASGSPVAQAFSLRVAGGNACPTRRVAHLN